LTTYTPYPKVVFAGVNNYADNTIASISINYGRRDVIEQPQPSYSRVELWTTADDPLNVSLSDSIQIYIKDTSGTDQQIYGGTISDIQITLDEYGDIGTIARYSITAVGALAQLNKRLVGGGGYAKEFDGTRILNILSEAFLTNWSDVAPTLTWAQVPITTTWASYDGNNINVVNNLATTIDTPGQYELTDYTGGETNALSLAQLAAQSGRGVLFETENDDIHYDDYIARNSATFITLTANDILANGLQTAAQWSEIVNDANVTYGNNLTESARDEQSIILYGQLAGSRTTQLHNAADALTQAQSFIESRAYPRVYPELFTLPLHSPTMTNATRNALIDVIVGRGITTSALPAVFGTNFTGYVEGITWRLTRYTAELALICSAQSETYPHDIWYQITPTTTWATYNITTKWSDL